MLEHVGKIAGMEGVAIVHRALLARAVDAPRLVHCRRARPTHALAGVPLVSARRASAAAHRRHDEAVAAAGAPIDLGAIAKFADPCVMHSRTSRRRLESQSTAMPALVSPGFILTNASSTSSGVTVSGAFTSRYSVGILIAARALRIELEVGARRQARAGAVPVPLVEDELRRRHQIEHGGDEIAVDARRRHAGRTPGSPSRIAATARARRTSMAAHRIAVAGVSPPGPFGRRLAERRRPRERQHIEIELSGRILPRVLRLAPRRSGNSRADPSTARRSHVSITPPKPPVAIRNLIGAQDQIKNKIQTYKRTSWGQAEIRVVADVYGGLGRLHGRAILQRGL